MAALHSAQSFSLHFVNDRSLINNKYLFKIGTENIQNQKKEDPQLDLVILTK